MKVLKVKRYYFQAKMRTVFYYPLRQSRIFFYKNKAGLASEVKNILQKSDFAEFYM